MFDDDDHLRQRAIMAALLAALAVLLGVGRPALAVAAPGAASGSSTVQIGLARP